MALDYSFRWLSMAPSHRIIALWVHPFKQPINHRCHNMNWIVQIYIEFFLSFTDSDTNLTAYSNSYWPWWRKRLWYSHVKEGILLNDVITKEKWLWSLRFPLKKRFPGVWWVRSFNYFLFREFLTALKNPIHTDLPVWWCVNTIIPGMISNSLLLNAHSKGHDTSTNSTVESGLVGTSWYMCHRLTTRFFPSL